MSLKRWISLLTESGRAREIQVRAIRAEMHPQPNKLFYGWSVTEAAETWDHDLLVLALCDEADALLGKNSFQARLYFEDALAIAPLNKRAQHGRDRAAAILSGLRRSGGGRGRGGDVYVTGYTRSDGTRVPSHSRSRPRR